MKDIDYLKRAIKNTKLSQDPKTQNGSLLVLNPEYNNSKKLTINGANQFYKGFISKPELLSGENKYARIIHAELNPIFEAAKLGLSTKNATLYVYWAACENCAKHIVQAGIKRVVSVKPIEDECQTRWQKSIDIGNEILDTGGVERIYIDHFFDIEIRRDGKLVKV